MALMYPPGVFSGTRSPGEKEIFENLRSDPLTRDWIVIHSLDVANHRSQMYGEIDFVIIVPYKGILCLEVKAVKSIRYAEGEWYLGNQSKPDRRGPFKQASEAMHSIREYIKAQDPGLASLVFFSAVVFPYVKFSVQSPEWHDWQVIDSRKYGTYSMGELVGQVLDSAREWLKQNPNARWFHADSKLPTLKDASRAAELLRPGFEFFESPETRAQQRELELKHYTQEQFEALDAMSLNPRVVFRGPAGTGKTMLALEAARREATEGKKVLFACFNSLLGQYLKAEAQSLIPQVTTNTLHAHMLDIVGIPVPAKNRSHFWEYELPENASRILTADISDRHRYDVLVVDEAQDIMHEPYLKFLDLSLRGGLREGVWRLFGDFQKQAIYETRSEHAEQQLRRLFPTVLQFSLTINCRNPLRVTEYIHLLGGLSPRYSRVRRPDNRYEPIVKFYQDETHQLELLSEELTRLEENRVEPSEIVILSFRKDEDSISSRLKGKWQRQFVPLKQQSQNLSHYGSIHSFKGLEAPVVIATDVDSVGDERGQSLLYIALSRALEQLIVLVHEDVRETLLNALLNRIG